MYTKLHVCGLTITQEQMKSQLYLMLAYLYISALI